MAERASASQLTSLEKQTAAGTPASPTKTLAAMGLSFQPQAEVRPIRPAGAKFPTSAVYSREWCQLAAGGEAAYGDLIYAFGSALGNMTGTLPTGLTFSPLQAAADNVFYLTVRKGDATLGEQTTDAVFQEMNMAFSREGVEVGGTLLGKAITFPVAPPTFTALPATPINPNDVCVYWAQSSSPGAPDKVARALRGSWSITGRQNPLWVLDCAAPSYIALVEGAAPEVSCTLQVEADTAGMAFITRLRTNDDGWLEFRCKTAADTDHLSLMTHCQVASIGELGDQDGVYAYEVGFVGTYDATWNGVTKALVKVAGGVTPTLMSLPEQEEQIAAQTQAAMDEEIAAEKKSKKAA